MTFYCSDPLSDPFTFHLFFFFFFPFSFFFLSSLILFSLRSFFIFILFFFFLFSPFTIFVLFPPSIILTLMSDFFAWPIRHLFAGLRPFSFADIRITYCNFVSKIFSSSSFSSSSLKECKRLLSSRFQRCRFRHYIKKKEKNPFLLAFHPLRSTGVSSPTFSLHQFVSCTAHFRRGTCAYMQASIYLPIYLCISSLILFVSVCFSLSLSLSIYLSIYLYIYTNL